MHFDLDEDERALRDGIRELVRGRFGIEKVRQGFSRDGWRELADAGVFGLRLAPALGGLGLGTTHAAVVYEELGRALVPGPLVASHLAVGLVDGAETGENVVGGVHRADGTVLVEHLDWLDTLLVIGPKMVHRVDPRGLQATPIKRPLDPLTPLHRVSTLPKDGLLGETYLSGRLEPEGTVLTAALQVGIAAGATDLAVAYAKEREQFGKPIGAFQAVKHLCAEMLVRTEIARSAVYAAAVTLDDPDSGDLARAVSGAKLLADDAAVANGKDCIQVHGGMGFTWEVDAHLYLKRALVNATHFGSADHHAEAIAAAL